MHLKVLVRINIPISRFVEARQNIPKLFVNTLRQSTKQCPRTLEKDASAILDDFAEYARNFRVIQRYVCPVKNRIRWKNFASGLCTCESLFFAYVAGLS